MDHLKTLTEERILAENAIRKDIISIREQFSNVKIIISLDSLKNSPPPICLCLFIFMYSMLSSSYPIKFIFLLSSSF